MAGNNAVLPPYPNPNSTADGNKTDESVLAANPPKATASAPRHAASVTRRPQRSESGPAISRPANPASPMALIRVAARTRGTPRSTANGTMCTIGRKMTSHVLVNTPINSQNGRVRRARANVHASRASAAGLGSARAAGGTSAGAMPSGYSPRASGSRTMNSAQTMRIAALPSPSSK